MGLTAQEKRAETIKVIKNTIIKAHYNNEGISKDKLISEMSITNGVSHRLANEMINDLKNVGFIEEDLGCLWLKDMTLVKQKEI